MGGWARHIMGNLFLPGQKIPCTFRAEVRWYFMSLREREGRVRRRERESKRENKSKGESESERKRKREKKVRAIIFLKRLDHNEKSANYI